MNTSSIKKASIVNIIGKYTNVFIGLIFSAILARLLTPKEFGTVAVVTVFTNFFSLLANMGIGPAIIHNKQLSEEDISHIYSFTVRVGLLISMLFALFSLPLSWFYGDSKYIPIGCLLSISLFFSTMNIVPSATLLKQLRFRMVNIRAIVVHVAASSIAVLLALKGASYFAIVVNSILSAFFVFLWNYITVKPKFILKIQKERVLQIREYSTYQFAFSFINYFSRNLDNILIGKTLGDVSLGFYNKSYQMMMYPLSYLTHVISPVLHPILSKYQDDKKYIYEQYMKVVKVLSLLGVFITVFFFIAADEIILIMFGDQWRNSIQSFRFLSLSIWAQMISSSTGSIFQSIGNTKLLFKTGLFSSCVVVLSILTGVILADINAVAISVSIGYCVSFFITFYFLIHVGFKNSVLNFLRKLVPDVIVLLITFTGAGLSSLLAADIGLRSAIIKLSGTSISYILALFITKQVKDFASLLSIKDKKGNNRS